MYVCVSAVLWPADTTLASKVQVLLHAADSFVSQLTYKAHLSSVESKF